MTGELLEMQFVSLVKASLDIVTISNFKLEHVSLGTKFINPRKHNIFSYLFNMGLKGATIQMCIKKGFTKISENLSRGTPILAH